ncbi:MAG: dephospho-CoA kinase [Clostridiales bacterium]|nr:dephospho-CoA kinase [Clostridiales bacterium]
MKPSKIRIIGITGGVGSGKTDVLSYIKEKYNCEVIFADEVAHKVREPGQGCYEELIVLLGEEVLTEDGQIDRSRMAEKIFADKELLKQVNKIIHPAVKRYILAKIEQEKKDQKIDFLFIEAALLIEDGYVDIVDELWYIFASEQVRRERLKQTRSYSDEKIDGILGKQLSEEEYKKYCKVLIDNSGDRQNTYEQIDRKLEEYLWQK